MSTASYWWCQLDACMRQMDTEKQKNRQTNTNNQAGHQNEVFEMRIKLAPLAIEDVGLMLVSGRFVILALVWSSIWIFNQKYRNKQANKPSKQTKNQRGSTIDIMIRHIIITWSKYADEVGHMDYLVLSWCDRKPLKKINWWRFGDEYCPQNV